MADELLSYYERELSYLRRSGAEFAAKYPKVAGGLLLDADKCEDPHVERLIQAFAFLAARIHRKLDDELPEITEALLGILYPHYLAPIPSLAIAQFVLDPEQGKLTAGYPIERGTTLYSQPVNGQACRFRTAYPVTLWPVEVTAAQIDSGARFGMVRAAAVLRLELRCLAGLTFAELPLEELHFHLNGESRIVHTLYEHLFTAAQEVQIRPVGRSAARPIVQRAGDCLRQLGLEPDDGLLPYPPHALVGYRLLQEYFALPEKFLFFALGGLAALKTFGAQDAVEILIPMSRAPRLDQPLSPDNFALGCSPVINLYEQIAEPIRLSHTETEYRVIPDVRRQLTTEVYAIESVASHSPDTQQTTLFEPFYSIRHATVTDAGKAFWYMSRRPSTRPLDDGTEVFLALVDLDFQPTHPASETLTVRTLCSDRDLPAKLPFGGGRNDFELEGAAPIGRIRCLTKPTETIRTPAGQGKQWRLISHLALNYLSITDGPDALREILRLYDFTNSSVTQQQIAGLTALASRRVVARPPSMGWNGFCRGIEVTLQFDEDRYVGTSAFLFATVLERFLGLYASLNSFVQVIATTQQREEPLHRWPPRAGDRILL